MTGTKMGARIAYFAEADPIKRLTVAGNNTKLGAKWQINF